MIITISGHSGSGKSTAAKGLSEAIGVPTLDVGQVFRAEGEKRGMNVIEFGLFAEANPEIDRELDMEVIRRAREAKDIIIQGRLTGWMAVRNELPAFKIWLDASTEVRAKRMAAREGMPYEEALAKLAKRDSDNVARYKKTYGLDLNDVSIYDAVVHTDALTVEEVIASLVNALNIWSKK